MISFIATLGVIGSIVWTINMLWENASEGVSEFFGTIVGIWIVVSFISYLIG